MITDALSYQDGSFTRPVTLAERTSLCVEEVPFWGGLAFVDATVAYRYDNGCLTIEDLELDGFEITAFRDGRDDSWFRWEAEEIAKWKQSRISEILDVVEQEVIDRLTR